MTEIKCAVMYASFVETAVLGVYLCTECGRKKSPIWEANKFKTKEDTENVFFLFLESTQNGVLHQRVLNKTSLKWRP